ncbi:1790_t:CDS:2, partial [Dentiscutata erythropus]
EMAIQKIVWNEKLINFWDKSHISLDFNIYKTISQQEEYRKNMIRNDSSLTENEKKFLLDEFAEKNNFRNWRSGNEEIDKLIQECQQKTVSPQHVIEWIDYDQFENIDYLTEGGCATIYTAIWKVGRYYKWNSEKQILERFGRRKVILKRLNNSNNNNIHWFQEVTLNFTLDNTFQLLAACRGLT